MKINFTIVDINDNKPQFDFDKTVLDISEAEDIGHFINLPLARDQDSPQYSVHNYTLNFVKHYDVERDSVHKRLRGYREDENHSSSNKNAVSAFIILFLVITFFDIKGLMLFLFYYTNNNIK